MEEVIWVMMAVWFSYLLSIMLGLSVPADHKTLPDHIKCCVIGLCAGAAALLAAALALGLVGSGTGIVGRIVLLVMALVGIWITASLNARRPFWPYYLSGAGYVGTAGVAALALVWQWLFATTELRIFYF